MGKSHGHGASYLIQLSGSCKNSSGFTLIELMMSVALLGFFMLILYSFLNFNFDFLKTHGDDQAESWELRKFAGRLVTERNLLEEIEIISVDMGGGVTAAAIQAVTDSMDLKLPPAGTGLLYYPLPNASYVLSYDATVQTIYYQGQIFAQGVTQVKVALAGNLILINAQGQIKNSSALETQIIALPVSMIHWSRGG